MNKNIMKIYPGIAESSDSEEESGFNQNAAGNPQIEKSRVIQKDISDSLSEDEPECVLPTRLPDDSGSGNKSKQYIIKSGIAPESDSEDEANSVISIPHTAVPQPSTLEENKSESDSPLPDAVSNFVSEEKHTSDKKSETKLSDKHRISPDSSIPKPPPRKNVGKCKEKITSPKDQKNHPEYRERTEEETKTSAQIDEIVIRRCHKCGFLFVKDGGSNKINCICGGTQCYLCGATDIGYNHFGEEKSCQLFTDVGMHVNDNDVEH
ncbi:hypothetical protein FO519_001869 [Halicephalobus sp. NKZ332]|nr:hypothetical protein FO519_001869 [Halicephalobus sp. NKZ332]